MLWDTESVRQVAVELIVVAVAGVAAAANAAKGWHRCQRVSGYGLAALCDGRGHVLFPWIGERYEHNGYTQVVTGFRRTGPHRAIVDAYADWAIIQGECGQNGRYADCTDWGAGERLRYETSDGGRHWRVVRFHRAVTKLQGPGPDPPVLVGSVADDPPLGPCNWSHADRHALVHGIGPRLGNWCAPPDEWKVPDSLQSRAG